MKIFKHKNIMGMIYGIVLAIPLLSILVRSAYVVVNKNAKDSYSDKFIEQQITINTNYDYVVNQNYILTIDRSVDTFTASGFKGTFDFDFTQMTNVNIDNSLVDAIFIDQNTMHTYKFNSNTNSFQYYVGINITSYDNLTIPFVFKTFNITTYNSYTNVPNFNLKTYLLGVNNLDNAFDYSLSKYVDDNSFGKLNFFEWFFDIFMDSNQQNNLYIRYVNWYMNYVLLVSCSYILFLVLMWFVNYSRRILERGLDYDW